MRGPPPAALGALGALAQLDFTDAALTGALPGALAALGGVTTAFFDGNPGLEVGAAERTTTPRVKMIASLR